MKGNRDMTHTYIGVICRVDDEIHLGTLINGNLIFSPISDFENVYKKLKNYQASVCIVEFQDGTEPVDFFTAYDNDFEDIFIWIFDLFIISPESEEDFMATLLESVEGETDLIEAIKNTLKDDDVIEKINKFKNYTEEWVEMH